MAALGTPEVDPFCLSFQFGTKSPRTWPGEGVAPRLPGKVAASPAGEKAVSHEECPSFGQPITVLA